MNITSKSKLLDVLTAYPALEDQIVNIAPPFKNLKNPVLRRTVGSLATLETVAQIGGMDTAKLVNTLRRFIGQDELTEEASPKVNVEGLRSSEDPAWIAGEPQFIVNGTALLEKGEVPVGRVNELIGQLSPDRFILLLTNFEPSPIISAMQKQNRKIFTKVNPENPNEHLTFIG